MARRRRWARRPARARRARGSSTSTCSGDPVVGDDDQLLVGDDVVASRCRPGPWRCCGRAPAGRRPRRRPRSAPAATRPTPSPVRVAVGAGCSLLSSDVDAGHAGADPGDDLVGDGPGRLGPVLGGRLARARRGRRARPRRRLAPLRRRRGRRRTGPCRPARRPCGARRRARPGRRWWRCAGCRRRSRAAPAPRVVSPRGDVRGGRSDTPCPAGHALVTAPGRRRASSPGAARTPRGRRGRGTGDSP